MKRILSLIISLALLLCLFGGCGAEKQPVDPVPEDFKGLVLTALPGVNVSLYTDFKDGAMLTPSQTYETEELNYYCYKNLVGAYRCIVSGAGYYNVTKHISMTQEKNQCKTVMDVTPDKKTGQGWEPTELIVYTDELLAGGLSSDISQWPAYADAFTTPHFTQEHTEHQMTTQQQMEDFLKGLDDADDNMYLYSIGNSAVFQHNIPMAIFTTADLSGADTLEAAAQAMGRDKPIIVYRAQVHGNEPAAGEAALAIIKLLDSSWSSFVEKVNICVIPRSNPDGAQNYTRQLVCGIDPNRDSLRLRSVEIQADTMANRILDPHVSIDSHEYKASNSAKTIPGGDIMLGLGYTNSNTDQFRELTVQVSKDIFENMEQNGLSYRFYSGRINSVNANLSRAYTSQQGTLFFLLESWGINCGTTGYPRRVVSHVISMESILKYVSENSSHVIETVKNEKETIIRKGSVYDYDDRIPLKTEGRDELALRHDMKKYEQLTGLAVDAITTPSAYDQVTRDRVAPTAYVIPAEEGFTKDVLNLMDLQGIAYTFIPAGSKVKLQQYSTQEADCLLDEATVTFEKGAYVFCLNQVRSITLSMLMEPDVDDVAEQSGTLVQQGIISATNGKYPLYRYIHDLNDDGFIDYR